jgi:UDP-2,3-diacylglucosamine pyrophosphatase LpxH
MQDAVIISDLHLGSPNCQARRLCRFLERIADGDAPTARLILNGDLFDSIDFRRLRKPHWRVLSLLRRLSDQMEIIWLAGNHDGSAEIISHLLGVTVMDEFVLESGDRRILIVHGHTFDDFLDDHPVLTKVADRIYRFLQWVDRTHRFAKMAKRGSKTFLRCTRKVRDGAVERASDRGCDAVCCGHTHLAVAQTEPAIAYYNSGCWTELPCTYLTVKDGVIRLHEAHAESHAEEAVEAKEAV